MINKYIVMQDEPITPPDEKPEGESEGGDEAPSEDSQ